MKRRCWIIPIINECGFCRCLARAHPRANCPCWDDGICVDIWYQYRELREMQAGYLDPHRGELKSFIFHTNKAQDTQPIMRGYTTTSLHTLRLHQLDAGRHVWHSPSISTRIMNVRTRNSNSSSAPGNESGVPVLPGRHT